MLAERIWMGGPFLLTSQFFILVRFLRTATGFNVAESQAFAAYTGEISSDLPPKLLPMQALDHASVV
jgi:hypothetical protein